MAFTDFDNLLSEIHDNAKLSDSDNHVTITANRRFEFPPDFEKVIAYEGDVNSQIITFKCPQIADGHDLSQCKNKRLRWVNMASGNEGSSVLASSLKNGTFTLSWAAPAEAFTKAGQLRFSISLFDFSTENSSQIAYSWNTAECSDLSVGASLETVGPRGEEEESKYIPAKDEILIINTEKRTISAPAGYRHMICNYGDIDTSVVYFQIKRYIRGIDILDANTQINIYSRLGTTMVANKSKNDGTPTKILYAAELKRDGEGTVNIVWKPTRDITNNSSRYTGKFRIQIEIISGDKVWRISPYDELVIGESDFAFDVGDLPEKDDVGNKITGYIIDGAMNLEDAQAINIAGVVKLRSCSENNPISLNLFELVAVYDDLTGKYRGVKIGTEDQQDSRVAPYVAYGPNTTIPLYGGEVE